MVNWGPFQDQYLHPIQADSFIGSTRTEKLNFKVSDSRIGKHPVEKLLIITESYVTKLLIPSVEMT